MKKKKEKKNKKTKYVDYQFNLPPPSRNIVPYI